MNYGKRHTMKRWLSSPIILTIVLIVFIILARAVYGIYEKSLITTTKLHQASVELAKLQAREVDLNSQVNRLSTTQGIEAEIRSKYKGVKDGESVAVVIGGDDIASVTATSTTAAVGWFGGFLKMIGL